MQRPKPRYGKQRSAVRPLSLSRVLPKLKLPSPAGSPVPSRPRPAVGKPPRRTDVKGGRNG